jgi:hypothetical protein
VAKTGRPSEFTQAMADAICEQLIDGESLRSICKRNGMPVVSTVCKWLNQQPEFAKQYARARELQADTLADEILHISNTPKKGKQRTTKPTGVEVTERDMIEHRRLQVDARKWYASKLAPRKYGEFVKAEVTATLSLAQIIEAAGKEEGKEEGKDE